MISADIVASAAIAPRRISSASSGRWREGLRASTSRGISGCDPRSSARPWSRRGLSRQRRRTMIGARMAWPLRFRSRFASEATLAGCGRGRAAVLALAAGDARRPPPAPPRSDIDAVGWVPLATTCRQLTLCRSAGRCYCDEVRAAERRAIKRLETRLQVGLVEAELAGLFERVRAQAGRCGTRRGSCRPRSRRGTRS